MVIGRLGMALLVMGSIASQIVASEPRHTTVGMSARLNDLVLPGPPLEVKPLEDRDAPVVLRIIRSFPHGDSFRYDLEYYALEPGEYDLAQYLRPIAGAAPVELPAVTVRVNQVLPEGQIQPNALLPVAPPRVGGYRLLLMMVAAVWFVGAVAIVLWRRERVAVVSADEPLPLTLADRLRPAVESAVAGNLNEKELAELERVLFAFWRDRLQLNDRPAAEAMRRLRRHPDADQLLCRLEQWLHQPQSRSSVDVGSLLEPYRHIAADAMPVPRSEGTAV